MITQRRKRPTKVAMQQRQMAMQLDVISVGDSSSRSGRALHYWRVRIVQQTERFGVDLPLATLSPSHNTPAFRVF